jgi:hypothetical protein
MFIYTQKHKNCVKNGQNTEGPLRPIQKENLVDELTKLPLRFL